jgi:hypothetical protein
MIERMRKVARVVITLGAVLLVWRNDARAEGDSAVPAATSSETALRSGVEPERPRGMTSVRATLRPFLSVFGQGGGAIADLAVSHYFATLPLRLSLEIAPLALAIEADGPGSVGHFRLGAGYTTEYVEVGLAAGSRVQNYGGAGISLAGFLRLGALDRLKFTLTYDYVVKRNRYTGDVVAGLSDIRADVHVPIAARLAVFLEGGVSADRWMYTSLGLRHRLYGDGGAGTWFVAGSFGLAWVLDRPDCRYPDTGWCENSAWAAGPTLGLGLERRF